MVKYILNVLKLTKTNKCKIFKNCVFKKNCGQTRDPCY